MEAPNLDGLASVQQSLEDLNIWALLPLPEVAPRSTAVPTAADTEEAAGQLQTTATPQPVVVAPANQPEQTPAKRRWRRLRQLRHLSASLRRLRPPRGCQQRLSRRLTPGLPFAAAGPLRQSSGDCAGASIRGVVRDSGGNPLAAVRLWRYDQWGNEQVVETKSGDADRGSYDFPLGDTPNVHYVQVIDAAGVIISPVIEVPHRQDDAPDATCHWLDWVQQ